MKLIIIFFVLISFNLKADDNLFGKTILCKAIKPEFGNIVGKKPKIEAYEFLNNSKVNFYYYFTDEDKIKLANETFKTDYFYETDITRIYIYHKIGTRDIINRETLEITYHSDSYETIRFKRGDCEVINSENLQTQMRLSIDDIVKQIKDKNKI
tara:strand:+ start:266 stop:727 length:462 start_codon:yes stop_codon:yes gene_type:complete